MNGGISHSTLEEVFLKVSAGKDGLSSAADDEAVDEAEDGDQHQLQVVASDLLPKGTAVVYKGDTVAEVVGVHFDDPPDPYYTIRLRGDEREKQTTRNHIEPIKTRTKVPRSFPMRALLRKNLTLQSRQKGQVCCQVQCVC